MKPTRLLLVIVLIGLSMVLSVTALQALFPKRMVLAATDKGVVAENESFVFTDSTKMAKSWTWFFGDGAQSSARTGKHAYKKSGKYLIKLVVDKKLTKLIEMNVYGKAAADTMQKTAISIDGPLVGFQEEYLVFTAEGSDAHWRWNVGEAPGVDSREEVMIHKYTKPGKYMIRLMSERSKYPALFAVEIFPTYQAVDSNMVLNAVNNDIRSHLQQIANGDDFNKHYYYLVNKYLCQDEHILVVINEKKVNDFFSYCMGLRLDKGTIISSVTSEQKKHTSVTCISRLGVKQHRPLNEP